MKWQSPLSVSDPSWLRSKLPQLKNDTYVLQLEASFSAEHAGFYETKEREEQGGLRGSGEGKEAESVMVRVSEERVCILLCV